MESPNRNLMLLLTVGETAKHLGVTTERVRQLTKEGKLRGLETPYGFLYEPEEVLRLVRVRAGDLGGVVEQTA